MFNKLKLYFIISSFLISVASVGSNLPTEVQADEIGYQDTHEYSETGFIDSDDVYINNIDAPHSLEKIKSEVTAIDPEDGDLSHEMYVVVDNYSDNMDQLGDFIIVFGVTDYGGTEVTIAITVRNVDVIAPVITVEVESTLLIPQYCILAANLPRITAVDSFEGDLTPDMSIVGLELIDTDVLGNYTLIYTVSDSTGNQTSETITVSVVDSTNPELNGPNEIIKRSDTILDGTFYLQYFTASDDHDGVVSNRISIVTDRYMGNANKPGTYNVVVTVTDTQGNYTNHTLVIKVVDDMIPRLIIDKYYWVVGNDHKFTDNEYIDTLKYIGDLPNNTYIFTTTFDNYENSYDSLDTYLKNFELLSNTGQEYEREIVMEVVEADANIVDQSPGWADTNSTVIIAAVITIVLVGFFGIGVYMTIKK